MNKEAQELLEKILSKPMNELTDNEIAFLKARQSYLKSYQLEDYKEILNQTSQKETVKKNGKKE